MKIALICPAVRPAVSQLAENCPLATAPILGECLVNHWIEHAAIRGAKEIHIYAADRPDEVRRVVGDGRRWGVQIEIRESKIENSPEELRANGLVFDDIFLMSHLPGAANMPLFDSYAGWYAAVAAWMPCSLTPTRVRLSEVQPGIWMSRRAHVSPRAQLVAPCWIGDQVIVAAGAIVGPGAVLEDRAVVDPGARVVRSVVGIDTYVGRMTSVCNSIAIGETLVNWKNDSWLRVPDPFLLCSLARIGGSKNRVLGPLGRLVSYLTGISNRPESPVAPVPVPIADRRTTP